MRFDMQTTKRNKWDELSVKLVDYLKEHLDEDGRLTKPASEILREFAGDHDTTPSSTSYYYYNFIRNEMFDENNVYIDSVDSNDVVDDNDVDNNNSDVDNKEVVVEDKDLIGLVKYIQETTEYEVSEKSLEAIEEMIEEHGAIKSLLSVFEGIRNAENIDILYAIINEAKSNM